MKFFRLNTGTAREW